MLNCFGFCSLIYYLCDRIQTLHNYKLQRVKENALSVANYFIDLARKDGKKIRPLKLMKLVYLAYGYALAIIDRSIIDPRFDKVEAWRYGPVIPSVYHSFKQYRDSPVTQKTVVMEPDGKNDVKFVEPKLEDEKAKEVCKFRLRTCGTAPRQCHALGAGLPRRAELPHTRGYDQTLL